MNIEKIKNQKEDIKNKLKEASETYGLLAKIGRDTAISQCLLSRYMTGEKSPSFNTITKLIEYFELD